MVNVNFKLFENGKLPTFKTSGAVCADCYARFNGIVPVKTRKLIPLGFAVELPHNYEMVVRGRSGLTSKGIDTGIGTIDEDYRGEVMACVINNSSEDFKIENGDRICQIAIRQVPKLEFNIVDELSTTKRGENGFGSTGK